jgi:5-formyltetrahydrofolate cyclo-ligase
VTVAGAKASLRASLRERLAAVPAAERQRGGEAAIGRLEGWLGERRVERLLLHRSLPTEVSTETLWSAALLRGDVVFAPRVDGPRLVFLRIREDTRWRRSIFGVLEPETGDPLDLAALRVGETAIVVPGLGFDERGGRLGRGGGHYDRFLRDARAAATVWIVAAAFDLQIVADVPREPHDEPVDAIVTESRRIAVG